MTFGKIKYYARQFVKGYSIPVFEDNRINRAILKHVQRIYKAQTKRKKNT